MREIKFRAWYEGKMYVVYSISGNMVTIGLIRFPYSQQVCADAIMQFTGLKDKNGVEIYEGDVVEYWDICSDNYLIGEKNSKKTIGNVVFYEDRSQFLPQEIKKNHKGGNYISHWDVVVDIEVIGNIHENPELIK